MPSIEKNVFDSIKELCIRIVKTKEEINIILKTIGLSEEDSKNLINFINGLEEVQAARDVKNNKSNVSSSNALIANYEITY